jgi:hypothetical protein
MEIFAVTPTNPRTVIGSLATYNSLIWNERYLDLSDFELKTYNIPQGKSQIPLESIVGVRLPDTTSSHLMYTETHSIEEDDNGIAQLVITGRGLEGIAGDNRVVRRPSDSATSNWVLTEDIQFGGISLEQIASDIWNEMGYGEFADDGSDETVKLDEFVEEVIMDVPELEQTYVRSVVMDVMDLYGMMRKLLTQAGSGMKITLDGDEDNAALRIYKGVDRRLHVIFEVDAGIFSSPKILETVVGYKNVAEVYSETAGSVVRVFADGTPSTVEGLDRKILFVDGSDITITKQPDRTNALTTRGVQELGTHKKQTFFDGRLNTELSPYKINVDYDLGDIVVVRSQKFAFTKDMQVTEYIRIKDENGYSEYPTLVEYS